MSGDDLPPLPPELRADADTLRQREPGAAFAQRLERALVHAEHAPARRSPSWWSGLAIAAPAITAAALILHLGVGDDAVQVESLTRYEEHHVTLDEDGHAWVELDLWTHHHEEAATVNVIAPSHMDFATQSGAEEPSAACTADRCTHSFVTAPRRASVRFHVTEPGSHAITVEHTSSARRVRERFVVHAR